MRLLRKVTNFLRGKSREREMSEEMRYHVELQVEINLAAGLKPSEARELARRQFGHLEGFKEQCRDEIGLPWLGQFMQDLRYGLRQLIKAPGFSTISILTIALGIGACTALFGVVNKVVLNPLDYPEPEAIVIVTGTILPKAQEAPISPGIYQEWVRQSTVFEELAAVYGSGGKLTQGERYLELGCARTTRNFFSVYRLKPTLGRIFLREEMSPGKDQVVILSQGLWLAEYGGRDDVLGREIRVDDKPYTVIGVVNDTQRPGSYVYLPASIAGEADDYQQRVLWGCGRLNPGVTLAQAQMEMDLIARRSAANHSTTEKDHGVRVSRELDLWGSNLRVQLFVLLGAVGFLLLIACVNVASLLLARANARQKEIAVRAALGASRGRIVRQFLCESLLIAIIGGAFGILLAYVAMGPLIALCRHFMPHTERIAVDGQVLVTMCTVMLVSGLAFGLVPALQATRGDLIGSIKESSHNSSGGRERLRVRNALVVVQVMIALILLVSTGLMIRSLREMQQFDQGIRTENVVDNQFTMNSRVRYNTPEKILSFTHTLLDRVRSLPEIEHAGLTVGLPMGNRNAVPQWGFILEGGHPPASPNEPVLMADRYAVTPDYFKIMSIPLFGGRTFTMQDSMGAPRVVVVNREMVRVHFPDKNPIGQSIRLLHGTDEVWSEIVGVVGDVKPAGPQSPTRPQVYEAFEQVPDTLVTLLLKSNGPSPALAPAVGAIFKDLDKDIKFLTLYPLEATISYSWTKQRFNMILFTLFSGLSLFLAAIGIYGVMAYAVTQRTHEIGIRMALGALPGDVLRLILTNGSRIIGIGLLLGTVGALACTRLLNALLFNVSPYDPVSFVAIIALLSVVGLLACWFPARKATQVDPLEALRHE